MLGVIHQAGVGGGGRCKNLHLFRQNAQRLTGKFTQLKHVGLGAARVGGDHVIGQELGDVFARADLVKGVFEGYQTPGAGFTHSHQYRRFGMFRRKF